MRFPNPFTMAIGSLALVLAGLSSCASAAEEIRQSSVGMPKRIDDLVLPGGELEAMPIESREVPVVLRIVATFPHGTAFRYDLEFYGLEAGRYDLRDFLQRKDGSTTDDLPELPIEVSSLLPPGQILPNDLETQPAPRIGGYRILLIAVFAAWMIGLAAILLLRRRRQLGQQPKPTRPLTLAERLRPLVAAAVEQRLSAEGRADIERLLLTYWRKRLDLENLEPLAAIAALREHQQAGALLRQVESWLHKPEGAGDVDIAAILEPYRDLPADAVDAGRADRSREIETQTTGGRGRP